MVHGMQHGLLHGCVLSEQRFGTGCCRATARVAQLGGGAGRQRVLVLVLVKQKAAQPACTHARTHAAHAHTHAHTHARTPLML